AFDPRHPAVVVAGDIPFPQVAHARQKGWIGYRHSEIVFEAPARFRRAQRLVRQQEAADFLMIPDEVLSQFPPPLPEARGGEDRFVGPPSIPVAPLPVRTVGVIGASIEEEE